LNEYYGRRKWEACENSSVQQTISFKSDFKSEKQRAKVVNAKHSSYSSIELSKYEYLMAFFQQYKNLLESNPEADIHQVIDSVWDFRLRGALSLAAQFSSISKPEDVGLLVGQMDFDTQHRDEHSVQNIIEEIIAFLNNDSLIKLKLFNLVFPHPKHKEEGSNVGVNLVYLQRYSKFVDSILDQLNAGVDFNDIITHCKRDIIEERKEYFKEEIRSQRLAEPVAARVLTQIAHPDLLKVIEQCENKKSIYKYIKEKIPVYKKSGSKYTPEKDVQLTTLECNEIIHFVREVKNVTSFIELFKRIYAIITSRGEEFQTYYQRFLDKVALVKTFVASLKYEKYDFQTLIEIFARSAQMLYKAVGLYNNPITQFCGDIKSVQLRFPKKLRATIVDFIEEHCDLEALHESSQPFSEDWDRVISSQSYSVSNMDIYARIGKFGNVGLEKRYRIAVGLALISWIQSEITKIRALNNRRKDIKIIVRE
jgi:hypothetical protein